MAYFRHQFPHVRVIPKQHLLEAHCVPVIVKWGVGLALLGEEGGEETQVTVNALKRRAWGPKSAEDRLRVLMSEHLTTVSPHMHNVHPPPRKK